MTYERKPTSTKEWKGGGTPLAIELGWQQGILFTSGWVERKPYEVSMVGEPSRQNLLRKVEGIE